MGFVQCTVSLYVTYHLSINVFMYPTSLEIVQTKMALLMVVVYKAYKGDGYDDTYVQREEPPSFLSSAQRINKNNGNCHASKKAI